MIDVNLEAEKSLSAVECEKVYQYPQKFNKLPVISYYTISEKGAFYTDNSEHVQEGHIQIDVWSDAGAECGRLSVKVNDALTSDGWVREMSMDVPKREEKIYHRTMRFQKYFTLNDE